MASPRSLSPSLKPARSYADGSTLFFRYALIIASTSTLASYLLSADYMRLMIAAEICVYYLSVKHIARNERLIGYAAGIYDSDNYQRGLRVGRKRCEDTD